MVDSKPQDKKTFGQNIDMSSCNDISVPEGPLEDLESDVELPVGRRHDDQLGPDEAEDGGRKLRQDVRLQMLDPKQILPNLRLLSLFRPRQLSKVIHFFYFFHNTQLEMHILEGPD